MNFSRWEQRAPVAHKNFQLNINSYFQKYIVRSYGRQQRRDGAMKSIPLMPETGHAARRHRSALLGLLEFEARAFPAASDESAGEN